MAAVIGRENTVVVEARLRLVAAAKRAARVYGKTLAAFYWCAPETRDQFTRRRHRALFIHTPFTRHYSRTAQHQSRQLLSRESVLFVFLLARYFGQLQSGILTEQCNVFSVQTPVVAACTGRHEEPGARSKH